MIAPAPDGITVYSTNYCPFCTSAKRLLTSLRLPFEEVDLTGKDEARKALVARTGLMTVPQIFIGTASIGGFTDLDALQKSGRLQPLLDAAGIQRTDRA